MRAVSRSSRICVATWSAWSCRRYAATNKLQPTNADATFADEVAPPAPPNYVPVEQRDSGDESLVFARKPSAAKPIRTAPLPEGCIEAPYLPDRPPKIVHYIDEHAERLKSTSVGAGRPLVSGNGQRVLEVVKEDPKEASFRPARSARRHREQQPDSGTQENTFHSGESSADSEDAAGSSSARASEPGAAADSTATAAPRKPKSKFQQLRQDIEKLEYFQGSPKYQKLLEEFREKYTAEELAAATQEVRTYTDVEKAAGLEGEPLDLNRLSAVSHAKVTDGPGQYHPINLMQQAGVGLYDGYAFSPSLELGKLNLDTSLASDSLKHQVSGGAHKDTSLLFKYFGVTDIQRRQIRLCLSDIDKRDTGVSIHVMMSYPYSDWLFYFYLTVGWLCLYYGQKKVKAYEFYDEYLGLDLRQVSRLQKPLLAFISAVILMTFLLQPIVLSTIATTRIYRILLKRPIGP